MKRNALLLLTFVVGCARNGNEAEVRPVASVTTAVVASGSADETVPAYGVAEFAPDAERSLIAPIEATLSRIIAPPGSLVGVGEAVAVLGPTSASSLELGKARSDAITADAASARAQRLRSAGLAGDGEVETARAAARTADAAARSLDSRFAAGLVLRSPVAGVVESVAVEAGGVAAQGATVVRIGALKGVRVRLGVDPAMASRLRNGLTVRLAPLAGGLARDGAIIAIDPRLDSQTRLAAVYVRAPAGAFAPGEPVKGMIVVGAHRGVTLIPRAALVYEGEQPYVFTVKGGAGHRQIVSLGTQAGDTIEVTAGLAAGERIVVDGASALEDGMAVREATAGKAGAGDGQ